MHVINQCKWDSMPQTLATPQELEAKDEKLIEDANFYVNVFGKFMKGKKEEKVFISPENMYDLDGEHSAKLI